MHIIEGTRNTCVGASEPPFSASSLLSLADRLFDVSLLPLSRQEQRDRTFGRVLHCWKDRRRDLFVLSRIYSSGKHDRTSRDEVASPSFAFLFLPLLATCDLTVRRDGWSYRHLWISWFGRLGKCDLFGERKLRAFSLRDRETRRVELTSPSPPSLQNILLGGINMVRLHSLRLRGSKRIAAGRERAEMSS